MTLKSTWIFDTWYDKNTWCVPYVAVVQTFDWLEAHADEGFVIAGVFGNAPHWNKLNAGGHTNRTSHKLFGVLPKATHNDIVTRRYVPAIDYKLPPQWMARYEAWYVAALRANRFPHIHYINVNGHHYNRNTGYTQEPSSDPHVHEHNAPGFETKQVPLPLVVFYNEVMHPEGSMVAVDPIRVYQDISNLTDGYIPPGTEVEFQRFIQLVFHRAYVGARESTKVNVLLNAFIAAEETRDEADRLRDEQMLALIQAGGGDTGAAATIAVVREEAKLTRRALLTEAKEAAQAAADALNIPIEEPSE